MTDDEARYIELRKNRKQLLKQRIGKLYHDEKIIDRTLAEAEIQLRFGSIDSDNGSYSKFKKELNAARKSKNKILADIRRIQHAINRAVVSDEEFRSEFTAISSTPSVVNVEVDGTEIRVDLHAQFRHEGGVYFLGDWRLVIDLAKDEMSSSRLNSGLLPDVVGSELSTIQYSWTGFCFGDNSGLLAQLVREGEYVTAVQAAVTYMNEVNREHYYAVPELYQKVG